MGINVAYWIIEVELEQMSKYLNLVQNSLDEHLKEIDTSYHEDLKLEMPPDEAASMEDYYLDAYIEAGREFPRLLLSSFIITWYSFVEQELIELCARLKLSFTVGPKDNEYFDKGIRRARKFLLKAKGYEIDSSLWQELINIGKLRNILVHEGKTLSCDYLKPEGKYVSHTDDQGVMFYISVEEALYRYLQKHNMVEISSPLLVEIVPTFEYCNYLVEFGKKLFRKLYKDLYENKFQNIE